MRGSCLTDERITVTLHYYCIDYVESCQWRRQDFFTGEAQGGHQFLEEGHIFLHINLIISVLMYRTYNKELSKIRVQIGHV